MPLVAAGSASKNQPIKKSRILGRALKLTFHEFADSTSIHGMQYTVDPKGNRLTKMLWAITVLSFFMFANVLVDVFWKRYKSNPTRVNVDTNHAPLDELDFPAITVCNIARISYERAKYLAENMNLPPNVTKDEMIDYLRLSDGFIEEMNDINVTYLAVLQDLLEKDRYNVRLTMESLMVPCSQLLLRCRFAGKVIDCNTLFKRVATWQGYCCSFNFMERDIKSRDHIQKANSSGVNGGLSLVINPLIEEKIFAKVYTDGIKMFIHENDIYPSKSVSEKTLPHHTETYISIIPEVTKSSSQIRQIPAETRGCVFPDEKQLNYFTEYKRFNCELETQMQRTFDVCECQPFFYPEVKERAVCQFTQIECLTKNYDLIRNDEEAESLCPIQCNQINYRISANSVEFLNFSYTFDPFYDELNSSHMIVHVFMASQNYRRFRKDLLSNIILLVSNLGGVYSLFVGMSALSFIEIFYFYSIRLYKNYKQGKENELRVREHKAIDRSGDKIKHVLFTPNKIHSAENLPPHLNGYRY